MTQETPGSHLYLTLVCADCGFSFTVPRSCGNRFCPVCNKRRTWTIREKLSKLFRQVKPLKPYHLAFLTLTLPSTNDPKGMSTQLIRSFRRLRQRAWWKQRVNGGAYVIEVTGHPGRWHVHIHAVIEAEYLNAFKLSKIWRQVSPGRIVNIQKAWNKNLAGYLTKYLTADKMPEQLQAEASDALKGVRMYQVFGTWTKLDTSIPPHDRPCPECRGNTWLVEEYFHLYLNQEQVDHCRYAMHLRNIGIRDGTFRAGHHQGNEVIAPFD